jgi:type IV fimbrial biogenesis protein FimT
MTMIETMIVVVLVTILVAGSVPGFGRILSNHRASSAVNDFAHAISLTRAEALKRGRRVYLAPVGAHWRDGWAVFIDRDDDRVFDPPIGATGDELIARHDALPESITIANPANPGREPFTDVGSPQRTYISFDGQGYPRQRNGAYNIGSLTVTDHSGGATTVRTICLAAYGRVRVAADRATC